MRSRALAMAAAVVAGACGGETAVPSTPVDGSSPPTAAVASASAPAIAATAAPILMNTVTAADEMTLAVTSPRSRGETAIAKAKTVPSADCTITVTYSSNPSAADGLGPKAADGAGDVAWWWTIEPTAPLGSWPVEVTCGSVSGLRAVARAVITVR